jgi:(2Fe-2S) ferredoxin
MRDYLKKRVKEEGLSGPGGIRVNNAGCLDRCGQGPVMVIYPEETWYRFESKSDVDEVFEQHIKNNITVDKLRI